MIRSYVFFEHLFLIILNTSGLRTAKVEQVKFDVMQLHALPELAAQQRMVDDASGDVKVKHRTIIHPNTKGRHASVLLEEEWWNFLVNFHVCVRCGVLRTWSWPKSIEVLMGSFMEETATCCCTHTTDQVSSSTYSTCGRSVLSQIEYLYINIYI